MSTSLEQKVKELNAILGKLIQNDIRLWLKAEEIETFENFLYEIIKQTGNFIKYETFANELWLSNKTVKKYLFFLQKSLIVHKVPPFFRDKTKEISSHSKFYVLDTGFVSLLLKHFGDKLNDGKFVETFVLTELVKHIDVDLHQIKVYKKTNQTEIDFILEKFDGKLIPIEAKAGESKAIPKAFYSFAKAYGSEVEFFVKTTKKSYLTKKLENFNVFFVPFWLVNNVI